MIKPASSFQDRSVLIVKQNIGAFEHMANASLE